MVATAKCAKDALDFVGVGVVELAGVWSVAACGVLVDGAFVVSPSIEKSSDPADEALALLDSAELDTDSETSALPDPSAARQKEVGVTNAENV